MRRPHRSLFAALVIGAVVACGGSTPGDAGPDAETPPDDGGASPDAGGSVDSGADAAVDAGDPTLVDVAHDREMRGVWVATVYNINFPSTTGLSAAAQREELVDILDTMATLRLNAIFFQVRPEGDALYESELEPWSRYLTGEQATGTTRRLR